MTVNVWERFGVKSISPSQLMNFNDDPGVWLAKTPRKVRDDAGPAAWRGDAVEFGWYAFLMGKDNYLESAYQTYENRAKEWSDKHDGEVHPEYDKEREIIEQTLDRAIAAAKAEKLGQPVAYQMVLEGYLPGYDKVKVYQKPDLVYEGFTLDLKTSSSIPSTPKDGSAPKPKPDHCLAFSCYAALRGDDVTRGLYVSTADKPSKPYVFCELDKRQIDYYVEQAVRTAKRMERFMTAALALSEYECVTPEQALAELCAPNLLARGGGLWPVWKDDYLKQAAEAIPEWGLY